MFSDCSSLNETVVKQSVWGVGNLVDGPVRPGNDREEKMRR